MPDVIETRLRVEGMSCGGCVASVKRVLSQVPGIEPLHVEIGKATVRMDRTLTSEDAVRTALAKAGYPATVEA